MKKPALLFSLKCAVILYFAACTNIDKLTVSTSATDIVTSAECRVDSYLQNSNDQTGKLADYKLNFTDDGNIKAVKGSKVLNGNWHEDNNKKTFVISFDTEDPALDMLNYKWHITKVSGTALNLETTTESGLEKLSITNL